MSNKKTNQLKNPKSAEPEIIVEVPMDEEPQPKRKRNASKVEAESVAETPAASKFSFGFAEKIKALFANTKFQFLFGAACLLSSLYLLVSFTSYIFTWKVDQDKIENGVFEFFANTDVVAENWLGKTGAVVSHLMIHRWVGVSAFYLVPLLFAIGFRICFKNNLLPLKKTTRFTAFATLWTATALGFVFSQNYFFLGGSLGYYVNGWLQGAVGYAGTALLLLFTLGTYIVLVKNITFERKQVADVAVPEPILEVETPVEEEKGKFNFEKIDLVPKNVDIEIEEPFMKPLEEEIVEPISGMELELETTPIVEEPKKNEPVFELEVENLDQLTESTPQFVVEEPINEFNVVQNQIEEERLNNLGESKEETYEQIFARLGAYDPTADLSDYKFPRLDLLNNYGVAPTVDVSKEELENNKNRILKTLFDFGIEIEKIKATIGPTVVLYEIVPKAGVKISKIKNLEDDIALSLSALGIRIIAPMPGKGTIGIEVPNSKPQIVPMSSILASEKFQNTDFDLPIALGKTISNEVFVTDLAKIPHLLMAGSTGQGKSVGLNAVLTSLLYKKHPATLKFVLVDPKKVELTLFNKIERHFLAKLPNEEEAIITDTKKVVNTLNSLCIEMDNRYELLKNAQVRNIKEYNKKFVERRLSPKEGHLFLPYIVVVVDEFADLIITAGKEVETPIARIAQLARAVGIHLIIATQRPSVNVITGTIKANFPGRIAFRTASKIDSRTILDAGGADQLIGRGDMLLTTGNELIRIQCAFVDTPEVESICEFIGSQRAYPNAFMLPEFVGEDGDGSGKDDFDPNDLDSMFEDAAKLIVQHQQGSTSLIQRRLKLGYNRAGRIIDQLEAAGVVGPFEGSKARQVLVKDEMSLEQLLKDLK